MKTVYNKIAIQLPLFPPATKRCSQCHQEKPLDAFDRASNQKSGYRPSCKECRRKPRIRIVTSQVCKQCHTEKPITDFYKNLRCSTGHRTTCKDCDYLERRKNTPDKEMRRSTHSLRFFPVGARKCYVCGEEKPLAEFAKDKYRTDGHKIRCKACDKEYRDTHKEEMCAYRYTYNRVNRELVSAGSRRRYLRNRERVLVRSRAYNDAHKEARSLREKRRRENNPIRYRQYVSRRRARKRMASVGKVDYTRILKRDGRWCYICGQAILPTQKLEFDHVIPLVRGGAHSEENIRVSHLVCNRRKGSLMPDELTAFHRQGV